MAAVDQHGHSEPLRDPHISALRPAPDARRPAPRGIALGSNGRLSPHARRAYLAEARFRSSKTLSTPRCGGLIDNGRRPRIRAAIDFYDTAPWIVDLIGDAVSVEVVRVPVDGAVAALRRRVVELAVIPVSIIPTGISTTHLCDDHLVAVVPSASPLASVEALDAAEMSRHPYLAAGLDPQHASSSASCHRQARSHDIVGSSRPQSWPPWPIVLASPSSRALQYPTIPASPYDHFTQSRSTCSGSHARSSLPPMS